MELCVAKHDRNPGRTGRTRRAAAVLVAACAVSTAGVGVAGAQLTPSQVLVVYDSRIPDSRDVAEYYAGSANVPGGAGNFPGTRPGVRVVDLSTLGAAVTVPGNIDPVSFKARLRDPLRQHLLASGLGGSIRCLVLTKGLPHRIVDHDNVFIGDNPGNTINEATVERDYSAASVDSELTLLWQDLDAGEAGGNADSKADGLILNPYWRSAQGFAHYNRGFTRVPKAFGVGGTAGPVWVTSSGALTGRLFSGDMLLVSRLDGTSVPNVRSMLDRALNIVADVNQVALLLDEDPQQFDNQSGTITGIHAGNDYELTRDLLQADDRYATTTTPQSPGPGVNYNGAAGGGNFYVGPLLSWEAGVAIVNQPVLLLASYGANHQLLPASNGTSAATIYATSFIYAPGAIFNTIESYNGRDFGGLGQNGVLQQQASSFLASGGTFAIGNVWEPFANSVPDNLFLAQNFLLGGLTWGEAAWTSIPTLSWMQVAVGDPLARLNRSSEDLTSDGKVDLEDLYRWENLPFGTPAKDLNRNGVGDTADRNLIAKTLRQGERASLIGGR